VRRRWTALDRGLRIELSVLALLIIGFVFWQARIPLDALSREFGSYAVAICVLALEVALSLLGAMLAGIRHLRDLLNEPPGPAWLALPVTTSSLARHLAWEARARALWAALPVPGLLMAAIGLAPAWSIPLLLLAFVAMLWGSSRLACGAAYALAVRSRRPRGPVAPLVALLATASRPLAPVAEARLTWPSGRWQAIMTKDSWLSIKPTRARWRLAMVVMLAILSLLSWFLPVSLPLARLAAFSLVLIAASACGEWLIALAGMDPFLILRGLPIGVGTLWCARAAWVLLTALILVVLHAVVARSLSPHALGLFLAWAGGATAAIALLAVNYGITLFPRADLAQRMFSLSLGLCLAASLMIPLMGWIVLLSAILHSARRLPRWSRLEDRA
jgi:hypothetical protein